MQPGSPSHTAMINALFRAIEFHRRPRRRRLLVDPYAVRFLSPLYKVYVGLSRLPMLGSVVPSYIDRNWPGARASLLGRARWFDDQSRAAIKEGIGQVVILGAGYDTRAYRLPDVKNARVFEVDHPDTIGVKMRGMAKALGRIPSNITYVQVDFESQDFMRELLERGFDRRVPTLFLLEGVMHYLEVGSVDALFQSIRALAATRGKLLFSYIHQGFMDGSVDFGDMGRMPQTLESAGEHWKFGIDPAALRDFLAQRGFGLLTDVGSTDYRAHYLGPRGRHLKGFGFYRSAAAQVLA